MKVYTRAGGGLGNRILGSVTSYYFSTLLNEPLYIDWPEGNPGCLAKWTDLFDDSQKIINQKLEETEDMVYIVHNPEYFTDKKNVICHRNEPISNNLLKGTANDIVVQDDGACVDELPVNVLIDFFTTGLKIKDNILDLAKGFCYDNNITNNTIGIHLRLTDMLQSGAYGFNTQAGTQCINENEARDLILSEYINEIGSILSKDPSMKFFICSDDPYAEKKILNQFPDAVIFYNKSCYVDKFHEDRGWEARDRTGVDVCSFNVSRSSESVIEAMIDCLILSRTKNAGFPRVGSFNRLAKYLKIIEFD